MTRNQNILAALFAFQMIVILLARSPYSGSTGSTTSHPLFPNVEAAAATRLQVEGDDDKILTLERKDGIWGVGELGGYPVDATKLEELIDKLVSLEVRLPVVSNSRYHKTFELTEDDNRGRLKLYGADSDDPEIDLIVGSSPNYRVMNVRRADDDDVFEVRGLASYDIGAEPGFWTEKQLVEIPEAELLGIKLTNPVGVLELARQDEVWKIVSPAEFSDLSLDDAKVESFVRAVRSIRIDTPVGPIDETTQGLANAAVTVELSWQPDATGAGAPQVVTYRIGSKVVDKETQRYVSRNGFGFTGTIWESSIKRLLEEGAVDLTSTETSSSDS